MTSETRYTQATLRPGMVLEVVRHLRDQADEPQEPRRITAINERGIFMRGLRSGSDSFVPLLCHGAVVFTSSGFEAWWLGDGSGGHKVMSYTVIPEQNQMQGPFAGLEPVVAYSDQQAVADGIKVPLFQWRWSELTANLPIYATRSLWDTCAGAAFMVIWNDYATWHRATRPEVGQIYEGVIEQRDGVVAPAWVINDGVGVTILRPEER